MAMNGHNGAHAPDLTAAQVRAVQDSATLIIAGAANLGVPVPMAWRAVMEGAILTAAANGTKLEDLKRFVIDTYPSPIQRPRPGLNVPRNDA